MIVFTTPTLLPIEAATTMGVSVKESDTAIGKFGTGLKYAIAATLRLNGEIAIHVGLDEYVFRAVDTNIRGKTFRVIHCNDTPCGFTTELGKHWKAWQAFRELASNTLDENGTWVREWIEPSADTTNIVVRCREIEASEREEAVFLDRDRPTLIESTNGATIYAGPSPHYYFRGIRAGSFGGSAPVTVNVTEGELSEDRLLDMATVHTELSWSLLSATKWDEDLLLNITASDDPGDFWCQHLADYHIQSGRLPDPMMAFLMERRKWVKHPAFTKAIDKAVRANRKGRWEEVEITERHIALLDAGERLCAMVNVDPIPREKVHFSAEMEDGLLACTLMDTRHVWFSTKLVLSGRDKFLHGYLEEALHAMTGQTDFTRAFQDTLFEIIVAMATERPDFEARDAA